MPDTDTDTVTLLRSAIERSQPILR